MRKAFVLVVAAVSVVSLSGCREELACRRDFLFCDVYDSERIVGHDGRAE